MDELGAGIAQSRRTVALIKVGPHANPAPVPSCNRLLAMGACSLLWSTPKKLVLRARPGPTEHERLATLTWRGSRTAVPGPSVPRKRAGWEGGVWKEWGRHNAVFALTSVPCCPVQSAALAERERVSRLFAEAAAILQGFQSEVLGFIEEGEATMLGRSQGDLRRQEEQRDRLSRARHNLGQVPEADSVSFLQVSAALSGQRGHRRGTGKEWREKAAGSWPPGAVPSSRLSSLPLARGAGARKALTVIYRAQELLALRLALEEGCGPGPGPPRELSFTKSSQAVRAVRDALTAACASQWEQLRGLGGDEEELQKLGTEGGRPTK